jgi:hypothetical protein
MVEAEYSIVIVIPKTKEPMALHMSFICMANAVRIIVVVIPNKIPMP